MTWFERMNMAIDYIENKLDGTVEVTEAAKIACQSATNFQRLFSILADVPLSDYIRRRRLTLAAFALQNYGTKIIDVAIKYGYDSPEAFSRAFHAFHGATPSSVRERGVTLKAYPRISILLTINGDAVMDYKIEKRESFQVYGYEDIYRFDNGENQEGKTIPQVWQDIMKNGSFEKLMATVEGKWREEGSFSTEIGAIFAFDSYKQSSALDFYYMICCFKSKSNDAKGYTIVDVPAATWAIFKTMPGDLHSLKKRIYTEWLPTASYNILECGNFEMYCTDLKGKEYWELWYAVEPKE